MTKLKKTNNFKKTVKKADKKSVKQTINEISAKGKDIKRMLETAYNIGYNHGYHDFESLPEVKGARIMAGQGYHKGMSDHKKEKKIQNKAIKSNLKMQTQRG